MCFTIQLYDTTPYYLFLDDYLLPSQCLVYMYDGRYADANWVIARTYFDFVRIVKQRWEYGSFPMLISFDHDLCDEHYKFLSTTSIDEYNEKAKSFESPTGYDVALWFVEFCKKNKIDLPECLIHSTNSMGVERIRSCLH